MPRRSRLVVVSDFVLSFTWLCSGVLVRLFVFKILGFSNTDDHVAEFMKLSFSIANMFLFAFLAKVSRGGAYNPLAVLVDAITGDFCNFFFCVGFRIPAQVVGYIVGVKLVIGAIPEVGHGPRLNVDILQGALTEGILTFVIVTTSLVLSATRIHKSFFMKTWISSLSKLTLHILGSNLTGGCMNPASVMAWTYARGDPITMEHIFVYWIAPVMATILAMCTFRLLVRRFKTGSKSKSD
ncbi:probable aquaporin SIP2-1 [Vicia villosa]|uniref:probable aquaporin SIP2-1 n=1 Tax=Vicia villosa TaxID=3911 RepID=UPI00273C891C|nr:probable aquaporin SIP2-1 [Vicia villosa]